MAHKTLTISEEAYKVLASLKKEHESFSNVILRALRTKNSAKVLLERIEKSGPKEDLASSIEKASEEMRRKMRMRGGL
jgi:predicted CopG family antitoxin